MSGLELTLLYLLAAVLGVVACRTLKLPPVVLGRHAVLKRRFSANHWARPMVTT